MLSGIWKFPHQVLVTIGNECNNPGFCFVTNTNNLAQCFRSSLAFTPQPGSFANGHSTCARFAFQHGYEANGLVVLMTHLHWAEWGPQTKSLLGVIHNSQPSCLHGSHSIIWQEDRWSCREISTTTIKGNMTMSEVITSWESLTKWQTITFITNSSDKLPWLPNEFISSQQWV